jgi:hypothetical protein
LRAGTAGVIPSRFSASSQLRFNALAVVALYVEDVKQPELEVNFYAVLDTA